MLNDISVNLDFPKFGRVGGGTVGDKFYYRILNEWDVLSETSLHRMYGLVFWFIGTARRYGRHVFFTVNVSQKCAKFSWINL